jgi:hypothetical protein
MSLRHCIAVHNELPYFLPNTTTRTKVVARDFRQYISLIKNHLILSLQRLTECFITLVPSLFLCIMYCRAAYKRLAKFRLLHVAVILDHSSLHASAFLGNTRRSDLEYSNCSRTTAKAATAATGAARKLVTSTLCFLLFMPGFDYQIHQQSTSSTTVNCSV